MLKLMPQERFDQLWDLTRAPACEAGLKLAHAFLDACGEAVDQRVEASLDGARFAFNRAWHEYMKHRKNCTACLSRLS